MEVVSQFRSHFSTRFSGNPSRTLLCFGMAAIFALGVFFNAPLQANGASYASANFVITAARADHAKEFAQRAEQLRKDLALKWLGKELPKWWRPASVTITVGPKLQGGGETVFQFDPVNREVFGWKMNIQGSHDRILDSVLPHEITHMIFASHFREPIPRWADEGAAIASECTPEQLRHRKMLVQALQGGLGIPVDRMFAMKEYPDDINQTLAFYAQAHSVTEYLLAQGGRRYFVSYLGECMRSDDWASATEAYYGDQHLAALQHRWNLWVASDFPAIRTNPSRARTMLAAATGPSAPETSPRTQPMRDPAVIPASAAMTVENRAPSSASRRATERPNPAVSEDRAAIAPTIAAPRRSPATQRTTTARPPSPQPAGQVILEWRAPGLPSYY